MSRKGRKGWVTIWSFGLVTTVVAGVAGVGAAGLVAGALLFTAAFRAMMLQRSRRSFLVLGVALLGLVLVLSSVAATSRDGSDAGQASVVERRLNATGTGPTVPNQDRPLDMEFRSAMEQDTNRLTTGFATE